MSAPTSLATCRFNDGSSTAFAPIVNGCWQLAGGHGREVFDNIQDKLWAHAQAGFTTFDTADIYGASEVILGEFQERWRAAGNAPVQIFTKYVPNIYQQVPTADSVKRAVERSLDALRVERLDLVQLHWWEYGIPGMVDTALALADLRAAGKITSVATTNMGTAALRQLLDAGVPVVANQVQFSLLDRRPLNGMLQLCEERGIRLMAYGSVGGGLLSDRYLQPEPPRRGLLGRPQGAAPPELATVSLRKYWDVVQRFGGAPLWQRLLGTLHQVADKHQVTIANVAVRWIMDQSSSGLVHPIIGLRGTQHITENAKALQFRLDADDLAAIGEVLRESKGPSGDCFSFERGEA